LHAYPQQISTARREKEKRCGAKPTEHQAILLHKLGLTLPRNLEAIDL